MKKVTAVALIAVSITGYFLTKDIVASAWSLRSNTSVVQSLSLEQSKKVEELNFVDKQTFEGTVRLNPYTYQQGIWPIAIYDMKSREQLYGFINNIDGSYIAPQFKYVRWMGMDYFSSGLEAVKKDNLYGYIDKTGKVVLDYKYEDAGAFTNGLATVKAGGLYGYIDKNGKYVIKPIYAEAYPFENSNGVASVKLTNGKQALINRSGKVIVQSEHPAEPIYNNNGYSEDMRTQYYRIPNKEKWALLKVENGQKVFMTDYIYSSLNDIYGKIEFNRGPYDNLVMGIINDDGTEKITDYIDYSIMHKDPETGIYITYNDMGYAGLYNSNGTTIISSKYRSLEFTQNFKYIIASGDDNTQTLLTKSGEVLIPPTNGFIAFYDDMKGYARVTEYNQSTETELTRLFDLDTKTFIGKGYKDIYPVEEGFVIMADDERSGLMDKSGKVIVEPYKFYNYEEHKAGYILKFKNDKGSFVADLNGNPKSNEYYNFIGGIDKNGYRVVMKGLKYGVADADGNLLIPCVADNVGIINKELARVIISSSNKTIIGTVKIK